MWRPEAITETSHLDLDVAGALAALSPQQPIGLSLAALALAAIGVLKKDDQEVV